MNPDREAAVLEKMMRDAKTKKVSAAQAATEDAARVLAECVREGLGWAEIQKRLAAIPHRTLEKP